MGLQVDAGLVYVFLFINFKAIQLNLWAHQTHFTQRAPNEYADSVV